MKNKRALMKKLLVIMVSLVLISGGVVYFATKNSDGSVVMDVLCHF